MMTCTKFSELYDIGSGKFRFTPKLPSICINQKYSMGVGSLHILYSLNLKGGLGSSPQHLETLEI